MKRFLIGQTLAALLVGTTCAGEARLLRFPAVHGDRVAFTHAGDLYLVGSKGVWPGD